MRTSTELPSEESSLAKEFYSSDANTAKQRHKF